MLAVIILLAAAYLRLVDVATLPTGLHDGEINDIRIAEAARDGNIEVFYDLGTEGREGLYHVSLTLITSLVGTGPLGYRMLSIWIGLLTVAATYALGKRLYGHLAGLSAMGVMAFTFWPVLLSRQITREMLIPFFVVAIWLCLTMLLPVYRRRRRRGDNTSAAAALGALVGLMLYVHPMGLIVALFSIGFIAYMLRSKQRMSRRRLSYIIFALLLMLIISLPYFISTVQRPELSGFERIAGSTATSLTAPFNAVFGLILDGDSNPVQNLPGRPLFDPLTLALTILGVIVLVRGYKQPRYLMLLFALVLFSPVYLLSDNAPNFANTAALMPMFALAFGLGISQLRIATPDFKLWLALSTLALTLGFNFVITYQDLVQNWADHPEVQTAFNARLGTLANHIDQNSPHVQMVVCGWNPEQSPTAPTLNDAQMIRLMMNRKHNSTHRWADCNNALVMTDGGNSQQVIIPDPMLYEQAHPAVQMWLEQGDVLDIAGLPNNSVLRMNVAESLADAMGLLTIEAPVLYPPEATANAGEQFNTPISFGGNLTFLGYRADAETVYMPGDVMTVVTYWRVDGPLPPDLRLFTHILADPGASPPANTDIIYVNPAQLQDRDVFFQVTYVPLPESLPVGDYTVSVGAYQNTSEDRLSVLADGEPRSNRLFLYDITISTG